MALAELRQPLRTTPGNCFISNYPPYSQWRAEHVPAFLAGLDRPDPGGPLGLYVHIPFCRQRCAYCYFRVYPRADDEACRRYADALLSELDLYAGEPAVAGRVITNVYFGGGTPSYLDSGLIGHLLGGLRRRVDLSRVGEFTFECEPGTVDLDKLRALRSHGVTRLSIGVQSLSEEVLRRVGRSAGPAACVEAYRLARRVGFEQINIDLIAGLPGETDLSWRRTVERIGELGPDCLTIYPFELTHNSPLGRLARLGRSPDLPDWPTKRRWTAEAFAAMERRGYTVASAYYAVRDPARYRFAYTVDHYWRSGELLALGVTAFGYLRQTHYQNADTLEAYLQALDGGRRPVRRAYPLSPEERFHREVILQAKTGELDRAYFRAKFAADPAEAFADVLGELAGLDFVRVDDRAVRLTRAGLLRVDWLLPLFYLPEHQGVRYW